MTRSIIFSALMLAFAISANAQEAVTLSADSTTVSSKALSIEKEYSQDMQAEKTSMSYPSTLKMREELKMGAGISVGGQLGLVGINGEFNFEDENSVVEIGRAHV